MKQPADDPAEVPALQDEPGAPDSAAKAPSGLPHGIAAYTIWGFMPVYFHLIGAVPPIQVVAHRVIWSVVLLAILLSARQRLGGVMALMRRAEAIRPMSLSAMLIAINWLTYLYAVTQGHVLAASLGYFLNPLVNVLLGALVLKERMRPAQWVAVALAAAGAIVLAAFALDTLWISLTLAISFAFYGLVRKMAPVGSMEGLAIETVILSPLALGVLGVAAAMGTLRFGQDTGQTLLLMLSGVVTSAPLLLFATAARRMAYSTLGLIQYVAPTIQFLLGAFAFGEPLSAAQLASFALIWAGLALFTGDALRQARRRAA